MEMTGSYSALSRAVHATDFLVETQQYHKVLQFILSDNDHGLSDIGSRMQVRDCRASVLQAVALLEDGDLPFQN